MKQIFLLAVWTLEVVRLQPLSYTPFIALEPGQITEESDVVIVFSPVSTVNLGSVTATTNVMVQLAADTNISLS